MSRSPRASALNAEVGRSDESAAAGMQEVCLARPYVDDRGVRAGAVNIGDFGSSSVDGQFARDSGTTQPALLLGSPAHTVPGL